MNILIDRLPDSVEIGGLRHPINTDYRTWVLIELMLNDYQLSEPEKIAGMLQLAFDLQPSIYMLEETLAAVLWFYQCGQEIRHTGSSDDRGGGYAEPVYSFEHDADYIYAAVLDQYGIDLQEHEHLHWWKFRALLKGLKEDALFSKIKGYRCINITADMTRQQKDFYTRMKKLYAIPLPEEQQEELEAIESALMGSGDLREVL